MLTVERCEHFARICADRGWNEWAIAWLLNAESLRDGGGVMVVMPAPKHL